LLCDVASAAIPDPGNVTFDVEAKSHIEMFHNLFFTLAPDDKYIDYLKAGNSDYPLNVIRKAGVDMEKEDYLNDAFAVFERRLNEFEALVEKLGLA